MKPCPVCQATTIGDVIGVQWGVTNIIGVVFNCGCGTTRAIKWDEAPEEIRHQAVLAEKVRLAIEGAI